MRARWTRSRWWQALRRLAADRQGAAAVQYGLIAALIAGSTIGAFFAFGGSLGDLYGTVADRTIDATESEQDDEGGDDGPVGETLVEVSDVRISYDAASGQYGVSGPSGASTHDTLESAVQGTAAAFGGEQSRGGTFNAQRIANGAAPNNIRVTGDNRLVIGGRSVGGQYRFDFGSAADAGNAQTAVNELFGQVGDGGIVAAGDR